MKTLDELVPPMVPDYGGTCQVRGGTESGEEPSEVDWRGICNVLHLLLYILIMYKGRNAYVAHLCNNVIFISLNGAIGKNSTKITLTTNIFIFCKKKRH